MPPHRLSIYFTQDTSTSTLLLLLHTKNSYPFKLALTRAVGKYNYSRWKVTTLCGSRYLTTPPSEGHNHRSGEASSSSSSSNKYWVPYSQFLKGLRFGSVPAAASFAHNRYVEPHTSFIPNDQSHRDLVTGHSFL